MVFNKDTAGDALRQAFMSREDYAGLREEERVWAKLQKPLCMAGVTAVWTVVVISMFVMVDVVFSVSGGQSYPFCQKRLIVVDDLPSSLKYTEEEAVDAFWLVAFLPSSFIFVFSIIYLFAGTLHCIPNPSASFFTLPDSFPFTFRKWKLNPNDARSVEINTKSLSRD